MKRYILSLLVLSSCYTGKQQQEYGVVVGKTYIPPTSSLGTGISTSGSMVVTSSSAPESYNIQFACEHGDIFSIQSKRLYGTLHEGDSVIIDYCPITNKDGTKVYDYDFVDARPAKNTDY